MTTVLYTGGTGRMGRVIREGLAGRYDRVVLFARSAPEEPLRPKEELVLGDLADLDGLVAASTGVDVIVHLGGIADEAFRREVELRLDTLDHRPGRIDFGGTVCRGRFHIHDHAVLSVDQIVRGVGKVGGAAWRCSMRACWIAWY